MGKKGPVNIDPLSFPGNLLKTPDVGHCMARVLIVDDAAFMRRVLRDIIEDAGHEVVNEAATGEEGLELYRSLKPDLVTLDLVMPGEGGKAALKAILDHDPQARVIVVSAVGQKDDMEAALKAGASDFLIKPFEKEAVVKTMQRLLAAVDTRG
jgi:two-component system, chemotaxis family, chemotaxis protein CheY